MEFLKITCSLVFYIQTKLNLFFLYSVIFNYTMNIIYVNMHNLNISIILLTVDQYIYHALNSLTIY